MEIGIYIHIPFCVKKCKYCAFNSIVSTYAVIERYVDTLCKEIIYKQCVDFEVKTIYIGGGTPTLLNIEQMEKIFNVINNHYNLTNCVEVTVEANPGTVNKKFFSELQRLGVNRLSIGVQSFDDNLLKLIGRIHNRNEAIDSVNNAKTYFNNVSIDLMYGLPSQTLVNLKDSIDIAAALDIEHISIYGLEIEDGTEFFKLKSQNTLQFPTEDDEAAMYDYIVERLPQYGWQRYEISSFAKSGFKSQHNLGYWNDVKYIGFGAGAHSYNGLSRKSNVKSVSEYINGINSGRDVSLLEEEVTTQAAMEEFCFLALRTVEGININKFKQKFGVDIKSIFGSAINKLKCQNLIETTNDRIKLTDYGMKFGNIAFAEFLI